MPEEKNEFESIVELIAEKRELEDELRELRLMARLASVISILEVENKWLCDRSLGAEREREEFGRLSVKLRNQVDVFEELRRRGW